MSFRARFRRRLPDQRGSMLIELVVAMTVLAIAVGALISLYASTQMTLRHTSIEGNALTLADKQIEVYKTLSYDNARISSVTIPSGSDPYVTANATDSTIPASTGEFTTGGTTTVAACTAPTQAMPECATQNWTGPDGRAYRVDSYVVTATPAEGGRTVKQVTIVVRRVDSGTVSSKIWARATTTIDQSNPPQ